MNKSINNQTNKLRVTSYKLRDLPFTLLLFFLLALYIPAQAQQLRWHWAIQASGAQDNHVCAAVCDTAGNVFLSGSYADTIRFEHLTLPPYGGQDIFIAKFDPDGLPKWAKSAGGINDDYPTAMTLSPLGDIIIAGVSGKNADFGGLTTGKRRINLFIGAYSPEGDAKWVKSFGAVRNDYIKAITTDSIGNIYFAGYFSRQLEGEDFSLDATSIANAMVICLDSLGQTLWAQQFYSEYGENRITALCHHGNNLWIAGICNAPTDINGTMLTPVQEGAAVIFTARFDEYGNIDDVYSVLEAANAEITSLTATEEGLLILGGNFSNFLNINIFSTKKLQLPNIIGIIPSLPSNVPSGLTSYGNQDMFLAAIHTDGIAWIKQIGSTSYDNLLSVAYHPGKHIIATGLYSGTLIVDKDTIGINNAFCDVFTASYRIDGQIQEVVTMGGTSEEYPMAMTFDKEGHIFIAGLFRDTTTLRKSTLYTPSRIDEVFLAKLHHCNKHRIIFTCDSVFIEGDILMLGLKGEYEKYEWDEGVSSSQNFIIYYNKTYQVLVSDSLGCVYKDSITIRQIPVVPEWQIRGELIQDANKGRLLAAYRNKEARKEN
ncbi:MAG: hypothetical protein LBH91_04030 [Prevotellaceae bacterium]|jgi:hypothetical protein|nr:hypothetical protein [Prevotellaceae bacterium]